MMPRQYPSSCGDRNFLDNQEAADLTRLMEVCFLAKTLGTVVNARRRSEVASQRIHTPKRIRTKKNGACLKLKNIFILIGSMGRKVYLPTCTVVDFYGKLVGKYRPYMDPMVLVQFKYVFVIHFLYPANQL